MRFSEASVTKKHLQKLFCTIQYYSKSVYFSNNIFTPYSNKLS